MRGAFTDDDQDDVEDEGGSPGIRIVVERPPLREGMVFLDYGERADVRENLETACVALNEAFRGIWVEKALENGHVREYWDEDDIAEMEALALAAYEAAKRAWRVLGDVVDAHYTQLDAEQR